MSAGATHLAFQIGRDQIRDRILIPKYYDPDLKEAERLAQDAFDLVELRDLLEEGDSGSRLGSWIRREWYGTGRIPYVRTSDLSHWRIRPDYKKGVSEEIYEQLRETQDVRAGDLLFVAHGTYLVGNVALVTEDSAKLLLQDHIFRLRVRSGAPIDSRFLAVALSTAFVRRQVRSRQFSADIIDKIGERHLGLKVPIPKDRRVVGQISAAVKEIIETQDAARRTIRTLTGSEDGVLRERAAANFGFSIPRSGVRNRILIPKYYDPTLEADLKDAQRDGKPWISIGRLEERGLLNVATGVEVGKMAYGTGDIPFVRTSDIAELEIRRDIRHGVSRAVYEEYAEKAALEAGDVLLVRDGTYLVGSSALVDSSDLPALICGGIFRIRSTDHAKLAPQTLAAMLNLPLVRRQVRAKQFTRDVIDTLGDRIREVMIPDPASRSWTESVGPLTKAFKAKVKAKLAIDETISRIEPPAPPILKGRPSWSMR